MNEIEIKEVSALTEKKVIGTQVPAEIYEQLKNIAKEDFMSISDLLRKIIVLYLRGIK